MAAPATRAVRSDGIRSRDAILRTAANLASIRGIEALSLGDLAAEVGMSKSGMYAHFGSKEELQLATVDAAQALFDEIVLAPAERADEGLERLQALVDGYLRYLEADTFPGGCFFASVLAEVDMQPGALRDRLVAFLGAWVGRLEAAVREAQAQGRLDPAEDPAQLTFEIQAALLLANARFVVTRSREPLARARTAVERTLATAAPEGRA